jgi:hypothetical protein
MGANSNRDLLAAERLNGAVRPGVIRLGQSVQRRVAIRPKRSIFFAFLFAATLLRAEECGLLNPFKVHVLKSSHKDKVVAPISGCRTTEGPCKASGTVFIVTSKKVKYTIFLVDGVTTGNLQVGESYSVYLTCGKDPMMILRGREDKALGAFYILEQEALAPKPLS